MCLTSSPWDFQGLRVQGLTLGDVEVLTLTCYYPGEGGEGLGMITVQSCPASSLCSIDHVLMMRTWHGQVLMI